MKSKQHWLAFAAMIALGAALGVACGEDDEKSEDLCADVECLDAATTCDPSDGICKCGTGDDRIICKSNEICQTEPNPSCLQDRCVGVICEGGQTCDPTDGVCKCGAFTCSEGEVCSQNRCEVPDPCAGKLCPEGQSCDSEDGACKCGGEICGANERCDDGICVDDPCKGVHCGGKSVCNPEDRACHCGTVTGEACKTGESCNEVDGAFVCRAENLCAGVECPGDSVCDPDHGLCRCGGIGTEFPECKEGQVCHNGECVGGPLCADVECAPGFQCDPNSGDCLCGGRLCAAGETCMALSADEDEEAFECVQECDPLALDSGCGEDLECYLDVDLEATTGYCAPEGSATIGSECNLPHDCVGGATCFTFRSESSCMRLCDQDATNACELAGDTSIACSPAWAGSERTGVCFE